MEARAPHEVGVDSQGIVRFLDAVEADPLIEPHGLIIHCRGARITEGYWSPRQSIDQRLLYSVSKTFTGTALGLQMGEGRLSLDDRVRDHLPEAFEGADPAFDELKIRHIASMASGHMVETLGLARQASPSNLVRGFLQIPPRRPPGKLFAYNQPPVIALASILQRLAGCTLIEYLRPRLIEPLGMSDMKWVDVEPGLNMGYSGLFARLDDVAKLGQLYLNQGRWQGRQLLPASYAVAAGSLQTPNPMNIEPDWRQGYGFQMWQSQHGFRGDGAMGQYMVVLPRQEAVVAMFTLTENMQRVLDLMWTHLLPAFEAKGSSRGEASDQLLAGRLSHLRQRTAAVRLGLKEPSPAGETLRFEPQGQEKTEGAAQNSHRTIKSITLEGQLMVLDEGDHRLLVPISADWQVTDHIAASAGVDDQGCIHVDVILRETPHRLTIQLDPSTRTFTSHWPLLPLFGAGIGKYLSLMKAPVA